jgi:nucleoside phosphorylase
VDNVDYRDDLRALEPEAIGGEMEGAGLYVACHEAKTDWILIKAICDWADGNKGHDKEARQALAAKNAAGFAMFVLRFVEVRWPR